MLLLFSRNNGLYSSTKITKLEILSYEGTKLSPQNRLLSRRVIRPLLQTLPALGSGGIKLAIEDWSGSNGNCWAAVGTQLPVRASCGSGPSYINVRYCWRRGGKRPDETARNQELTESRGKISSSRWRAAHSRPRPGQWFQAGLCAPPQSSPPSDHKFA